MGSKQDSLCRQEDIGKTQELTQDVAETKEIKITSTVILCISLTREANVIFFILQIRKLKLCEI